MKYYETIYWEKNSVKMIDQRLLPDKVIYNTYTEYTDVADAIKKMVIRGAPAIGVAACMGIALGIEKSKTNSALKLKIEFDEIAETFRKTRPTAVNLFWAIERMKKCFQNNISLPVQQIKKILVHEAINVYNEDIDINKSIGKNGAVLLKSPCTILTHCNAGALATAGYGTALGVIRSAFDMGKKINVFADETRPFLQGSRLTVWELQQYGIPVTLITDSMAGHFMSRGKIDAVVVGADRIAANGDTANKIGTYSLSVLANENKIPFYVAAPISTIDTNIDSGEKIPIEERSSEEIHFIAGKRITPIGTEAANPAFDITPSKYISAIITEKGVIKKPFKKTIKKIVYQ
ncbi:MAG: S-methyl-5-thioribose-1-phosphate isomerase [Candidatus Firestonebacteria bacterium]|nr:S-methyl-5-thioribose-1-phosphate isomerase [Candidatus Firestonebacteria bacterium]